MMKIGIMTGSTRDSGSQYASSGMGEIHRR